MRVVRESRFLRVVRKRRESRFLRVVLREEVTPYMFRYAISV